ncbi:cell wall metabolism sensor histidine kinase WalK [Dethiobacter alkaliphilus]|uniref:cell wall metabolism sensor histidine kinase WalK n=1 Tax=Dethiobacter alkaliphilus TaxID=427926 RepID=UPI0022261210|nr:cell wall metabolism sensor histidine kinase WalK [Dethiobacter alkaliphilus]MCW3488945.1 cell wall metabolism sensor histidine kinase WalK [Dethiobacter alkaliphilus]
MFRSVQWKIVFIYSLLILFAMQFFAVFLTQSLERYYLDTYAENLESQGLLLANFVERYLAGGDDDGSIDGLVLEYSRYAGTTDIMVLDAFGRVVSSSRPEEQLQGQRIFQEEITRALTGSRSEEIRLEPETRERVKYLALPVRSGEKTLGVVYLIGSLEPIYATLREIQFIFLTGAVLVIGVTVLLGFFLAKTITGPIQEVTSKAAQIAHGDFRQRITIHSQDEIGRLGQMFNYLSRQLDATLREISSEKGKVEAILNHMTDGIVALNRDGQVLHVNPTAHRLLGLNEESEPTAEVLGQLVAPVDLAVILNTGRQESREILLQPHQQLIVASYVPFHTQDEITDTEFLSGVLIVLHDVTKERELIRIQQEFVANVSHELRTPLTTMKSYTETLLGGAMYEPETCLSFLSTMEKETERMVRLVKDLLVLSQLDYRQVAWRKEKLPLNELVSEVVNELRVKFQEEPRHVSVELPETTVWHCFDRDKMKQVLINVIQNSFKYTAEQGLIRIALEVAEDQAVIHVADDGIGIPPEDVKRVFDRFYRVDKARSRDFGGTGLGLSIAREIVEAHGGSITVCSEPEQGTQFTISLPLTTDEGGADACESA